MTRLLQNIMIQMQAYTQLVLNKTIQDVKAGSIMQHKKKIKKICVCENSMIAEPSVAIHRMTCSHYTCGVRVSFAHP